MEGKHIDLGGGYRLRRFDSRNWALQQWRAPSESRKANDRSERWMDTGNYFQQLGPALAFVLEMRMRDEGEPDEPLRDAMERVGVVRDELMAAVA